MKKNLVQFALVVATMMNASLTMRAASAQQDFPRRSVTLIVPFAAGGATDSLTRIVADGMRSALENKLVVENRPGAVTQVGVQAVLAQPADGHTFLLGGPSTAILRLVNKGFETDLRPELIGVAGLGIAPLVICVNTTLPVKSLSEFVSYAKANPGAVNYGVQGASDLLANISFASALGIEVTNVRYGGGGQMKTALMRGDVHYGMFYAGDIAPLIASGHVRPIATTGLKRHPDFADLPTIAEASGKDVEFTSWSGLFARSGTPKAIIDRMSEIVSRALQQPEIAKRTKQLGFDVMIEGPDVLTKHLHAEMDRWERVAKDGGFRPE
jgi:tripartite-type tricarboxylate transporter receptor subunit TctC